MPTIPISLSLQDCVHLVRADKPPQFKVDRRPPELSYWCLAAVYSIPMRDGEHVFPPEAFQSVAAEDARLDWLHDE